MKTGFLKFIRENKLLTSNDKPLLAVSGGIDSMVMLHLFAAAKIPVGVAHCNFQLRGEDAVGDEKLVETMAQKYGFEFHTIRFDTKEYAATHGISIQMAARDLRYDWFKQVQKDYHYTLTATAHHGDDVVETFLLNMLRKTGIAGLHGIKAKAGDIIRPMLFTSKKEILEYAQRQNIAYREDVTNADDHYMRNFIRLRIIPAFQQLNPNFATVLQDSIRIISKQEMLYKEYVDTSLQSIAEKKGDSFSMEIKRLETLSFPELHLFEWLRPLGFNEMQVADLMKTLQSTEEKMFVSSSYTLLKTRTAIACFPIGTEEKACVVIQNPTPESFAKAGISIDMVENAKHFAFENNRNTAYFDMDTLQFPLHIRHWRAGDYFFPFGGKGKKKISDFFSENKLNSLEKQNIKLLCNRDEDIVWIMGFRSDNRYRVTSSTRKILVCRL